MTDAWVMGQRDRGSPRGWKTGRAGRIFAGMENVHKCTTVLSPLIAEADTSAIPLAEKAINEMVAMTPAPQQRDALESVRSVVKAHGDAAGPGSQCDFADAVNDYIEKLMSGSAYDPATPTDFIGRAGQATN